MAIAPSRRVDAARPAEGSGGPPRRRTVALDESRLDRSVLALAWPVLVQQLALSLVQLVDTFLVGHIDNTGNALAGVGLATFIQWTPQAGVFAIAAGTTAVLARDIGSGQPDRAAAALRHGLLLSLLWGLVGTVLVFFAANWTMGAMGATGDVLTLGASWLRWASPGILFGSLLFVANSAQQGAGDTRTPMAVMLCVNIVNAIVAFGLIYGSWFLPKLGVRGSGIGFSVSQLVGMALTLAILTKGRAGLRLHWPSLRRWDGETARRILNVGVPSGVEQVQFQFAMLVYTRIIASLGETALAAHSVAIRIQGLAFMPGMAFQQAATAFTGQALGAGKPQLAERATFAAMRFALYILGGVALLLALFGGPITRAFVDDPAVTSDGRQLLLIFAVAQPAIAIAFTFAGSLRGAGDTRAVMVIFAISPWILRVTLAYLFAIVLGWGVGGAWIGAVADMWVRAGLTFLRFRRGRWQTIRV
ncbi:MAG TPA: MATE family efflux transporter [Dehalococcoidia bacterium]|nr:MATE family efflux transporter [Dehalococcoidia bacterium]